MKMNKGWHLARKMPKNATLSQHIDRNSEYFKNCECRIDLPEKMKAEMRKRGIAYRIRKSEI